MIIDHRVLVPNRRHARRLPREFAIALKLISPAVRAAKRCGASPQELTVAFQAVLSEVYGEATVIATTYALADFAEKAILEKNTPRRRTSLAVKPTPRGQ